MLNLFRRKRIDKTLKGSRMGYVDIHCHILPGMDDGAQTLEDSLALAREAAANGVSDIIATPHFNRDLFRFSIDDVRAAFSQLQTALDAEDIPVTLHIGAEVRAAANVPEGLKTGVVPTLAGSKYVLLELPFDVMPPFARELVFQIQLAGVTPILAHPERISHFQRDSAALEPFLAGGCRTQINSTSLTGYLGRSSYKTAISLLKRNWVHIIGSDGHKAGSRGINFAEAVSIAAKHVGVEAAIRLVNDAPRQVLESGSSLVLK